MDTNKNKIEFFENYENYKEHIKEQRNNKIELLDNNLDSKQKIIKLLELEYEDLEKQQSILIYSNDQMLNFDPNDIEVIECRAENLKFIQKNIERMKEIKKEIVDLDKNHPYVNKDVYNIEKFNDEINTNIRPVETNDEIIIKELEL